VVVVAATVTAVVVLGGGGGRPSTAVLNVALQPIRTVGANPFMPAVGDDIPAVKPPEGVHGSVVASTPGLFGGTRDNARCDSSKMTTFLKAHPDLLAAWSAVLGIRPDDLDMYVRGLTPVTLRADTAVTNHGFKDGHVTAVPAILQAGTAVLADSHGTPVVKCFCGNPLTPPARYSAAEYTGPRWAGFGETNVISVQPVATPVKEFVLVDAGTGKPFQRAAGTSGKQDHDYAGTVGGCGGAGTGPFGGGLQLVVISGNVPCATARQVLNAYRVDLHREGSGGFATVEGWSCGHHTAAEIDRTGDYEFCSRGGVTFGTKRALTVSAVSTTPLSRQWSGTRLASALLASEFYFPASPGLPAGGQSGRVPEANSGNTVGLQSSQVKDLAGIDCPSLAPYVDGAFAEGPTSFPGESAYAYKTYDVEGVAFTTEILQFGTDSAAADLLAAMRGAARRCADTGARAPNIIETTSADVDGYPATGYLASWAEPRRVLLVANGVDVVCVSVILGGDNVPEPAKPTLAATADAVMAGIATLDG
jgi:hypothetical protein